MNFWQILRRAFEYGDEPISAHILARAFWASLLAGATVLMLASVGVGGWLFTRVLAEEAPVVLPSAEAPFTRGELQVVLEGLERRRALHDTLIAEPPSVSDPR